MCMCESLYELRVMSVFDHSHKTAVIRTIFDRVDDRVHREYTYSLLCSGCALRRCVCMCVQYLHDS